MTEKKGEYNRAFKALEQSLANILDQVQYLYHIKFLLHNYTAGGAGARQQ